MGSRDDRPATLKAAQRDLYANYSTRMKFRPKLPRYLTPHARDVAAARLHAHHRRSLITLLDYRATPSLRMRAVTEAGLRAAH